MANNLKRMLFAEQFCQGYRRRLAFFQHQQNIFVQSACVRVNTIAAYQGDLLQVVQITDPDSPVKCGTIRFNFSMEVWFYTVAM